MLTLRRHTYYNKIILEKNFHLYQTKHVEMETNATNVESAALWLFDIKFNHIVSIITRPLVYAISNHKS